jgi:hypothetical protein
MGTYMTLLKFSLGVCCAMAMTNVALAEGANSLIGT